jgi:hypothetical protein
MGVHVRTPLDYDIDELTTRLRREAVVLHVCAPDFPGEASVSLGVACRAPDRGRSLFLFGRTAEEPFSAGGISGFNDTV